MPKADDGENRQIGAPDEKHRQRLPSSARLLPAVMFGLGTAILAGVVIVPSPARPVHAAASTVITAPAYTTASLTAPINEHIACGPTTVWTC